jgi:hypothetical protein
MIYILVKLYFYISKNIILYILFYILYKITLLINFNKFIIIIIINKLVINKNIKLILFKFIIKNG